MQNLEREKKRTRFSAYCVGSVTLQSSHECHLVDRPCMVTWRAVGTGIVELVDWKPLKNWIVGPEGWGPWGWRTQTSTLTTRRCAAK